EFDVYFLIHSDWGVVNFQGVKLVSSYPKSIKSLRNTFSDGSSEVEQDTAYASCFMKVVEIDPGQITLEPAYPAFSSGWAKRVRLHVKTGAIKPGKYAIGLDVVAPDLDYSEKMSGALQTRYVTGGGFSAGRPWLMLYVEIRA
ncbi:MAG: hypothetical protein ABH863_03240, partial [Candidatus Micrarchaeota archaeon]